MNIDDLLPRHVRSWNRGKASDEVRLLIEEELKRPDSVVREYLDWKAGRKLPDMPRLMRRHFNAMPPEEFASLQAFAASIAGKTILPEASLESTAKPDSVPNTETPKGLRSEPSRKRLPLPKFRLERALAAACVLAILGAFSGCAPVNARPVYGVGLGVGIASLFAARRMKTGWLVPALAAAAIVLNAGGLVLWPNVVGFFHETSGYKFRFGRRLIGPDGRVANQEYSHEVVVSPRPGQNERIILSTNTGFYREDIYWHWTAQYNSHGFVGLERGTHMLTVELGGSQMSRRIRVPEDLNPETRDWHFTNFHPTPKGYTNFLVARDGTFMVNLDDAVMILDGNSFQLGQRHCVFTTPVGWHDVRILRNGKQVFSAKIWMHPVGEGSDVANPYIENTIWYYDDDKKNRDLEKYFKIKGNKTFASERR